MDKKLYPLTNPQKSIWYTEQFFNKTPINNICSYAIIHEPLDFDALKKAINLVVKQNDAFRLQFCLQNNEIMQYVKEYKEFDIEIIDLVNEKQLQKLEQDMSHNVFDIFNSDLYLVKLIQFPDQSGAVLLNVHHLIADSWSMGLAIKEILKNYRLLLKNENYNPNNSYINYIKTETEYINSSSFEKDKEYWQQKFKKIPELATIPSLKNSKTSSNAGKRISFTLGTNIMKKINSVCSKNKFSVFNFFMAVYSLYISRVSGIDDFVIGTPIINRKNVTEKNTMGMFINTLPLRINTSSNNEFKDFCKDISVNLLSSFRHQKYSYNNVLNDLRKQNSNIPNLYNVLISYQITKAVDNEFGDYSATWMFNNCCGNDINIHLHDLNDTGELLVSYDYLIDKYSSKEMKNIHNRILHIIDQIVTNNEINLNDIEIVTKLEKSKILDNFNNVNIPYPTQETVLSLFEKQVNKTPDNIAVKIGNTVLTYKELNEKANSLARFLIQSSVKEKSVVGIRLDKSFEMIIGILAIMKCGSCYLPINMSYPEDRVNFMLKDSNSTTLLCNDNSFNDMKLDIHKINISLSNDKIYSLNKENLCTNLTPEDLIYIIYTSGSTGTPKGAMLCHRNVVRLFKNNNFLFDFDESDVWTMFHSVAFDFSVWEMYGALLFGGKLILVPDDIAKDPKLFLDLLREEKVTVLNQTPTYFYNLQNAEMLKNDSGLGLRYIIFGGEALKPNLLQDFNAKYPFTKLINMYGITETTVHVTFRELSAEDLLSPSSNIGTPIPTLQVVILDKNLNLLPLGVAGEMCVLGEGVFKGYLNRPELNTTKLVNLPVLENRLIYRSADSAILHEDGHLEYLGRIDNQIKIRGFRVELGEIEEKILNHSNISTCIVTKKIDENKREMLCAYYIKSGPINISNLRIVLKKYLPDYMIPQYFIEINKVPININGKTDYKALPTPNAINIEHQTIEPRNDLDKIIIKSFKEILHTQNIGISDSFFELGGDSLSAINVSNMIAQNLNTEISVKDILEHPIIEDLSDYIKNRDYTESEVIKNVPKEAYYPTSSAQKRMYYTSKISGKKSVLYNISGGIIFDGNLNIQKLSHCFKILVHRHEALRTYFTFKNDEIVQVISDKVKFKIPTEHANNSNIDAIFKKFVKPFNLGLAPLFRVKLVYFKNNTSMLLLDMHHIIGDGASLEILVKELCALYNNEDLPEKNIDYKDFAVWDNTQKVSDKFTKSKEFWLNNLSGDLPLLDIQTTYPRPAIQSFEGSKYSITLDNEIYNKISHLAKSLEVTPYMLLLSAYYILLYKYSGQEDIIIGTPIANRNLKQLKNILGMFVNTLALRNKIDKDLEFYEFVKNIKTVCTEAFANSSYPFDDLVNSLDLKRDNSRNPIFDTMFTYQNNGYPTFNFDKLNAKYYIPNNNISKFDLSLEVIPKDSTYTLNFEYCTKLFDANFIKRFSKHFINILDIVLDNHLTKISDINMVSDEEKNKILNDFNSTSLSYPRTKTIIGLIEEQVAKNPYNIALKYKDDSLTYSELNKKANKLANYLVSQGIKKQDVVSVCLDKDINLIVSILAILKIGAIYMPIFNEYPAERINYMIENSNSKMIITNNEISKIITTQVDICLLNGLNLNDISDNFKANEKLEAEDIIYVIYTSGSTGNPKGVKINNLCLNNFVHSFGNLFKINNSDVFLSSTNISFDVSIFEIFLPLTTGATLVLHTEKIIKNIFEFCRSIIYNNVTALYIPPNILNEVYGLLKDNPNCKISKLLVGVEPIRKKTLNQFYNLNKDMIIVNGYGPTETTICATALKYKKDLSNNGIVSIGKPIHNNKIYILDSCRKIVPIGIVGEIYVSGDGVGLGYLNNEAETAKNYITHVINGNTKRLYKTGDLAKWNTDGTITFVGRKDRQIKFSGYRIELSEIEYTMLKFPGIKKVFILPYEKNKNLNLVAYYTSDSDVNTSDLSTFLRSKLAFYMIPKAFIRLDEFPTNNNGKIDNSKLPVPNFKVNQEYVAPQTDSEKILCDIIKKLFSINRVGINDNFFDLGGDSLLAIKLQIEALNKGLYLEYEDIFSYPIIRDLASREKKKSKYNLDKDYDYTKIDKLLHNAGARADVADVSLGSANVNNILLIGATGFLGSHLLDAYLSSTNGIAYCLVRENSNSLPEERLKKLLNFYFEDKYDSYFGNRIKVIVGDITKKNLGMTNFNPQEKNISCVINSAAFVKHYGDFDKFKNININGVKNVSEFCKNFNLKLYHISTTSVSGFGLHENLLGANGEQKNFDETNFYIGQNLNNAYVYTKFEAEKLIFNDIIKNKLNACILRVGSITNRYSDGHFQLNLAENAFVNRVKSMLSIGLVPDYLYAHALEFTPVDCLANAIMKVVLNNCDFPVLHLCNPNLIKIPVLLKYLNQLGFNMKLCTNDEFVSRINEYLKDKTLRNQISGIINDLDKNKSINLVSSILINADFSKKYLETIGFKWPEITEDYIQKFIEYFKINGYF